MTRRLLPALSLVLHAACSPPAQPVPGDISSNARANAPPVASASPDEAVPVHPVPVHPMYGEPVPELPEARQLCDALHLLPARRSGACCATGDPGPHIQQLADACSQALSSAVASGGLVLLDDPLEACIAGLEATYTDCQWVGAVHPPLPSSCLELSHGSLPVDARCRSSRECAPTLHCAGLGPDTPGVCAPAAPVGAACNTTDTLAGYLRDTHLTAHPACTGRCTRQRCQPALPAGAACIRNDECSAGLRCDGKACVPGDTAATGQPCTDDNCAAGDRCSQHVCVIPAPTGTPCQSDAECRGACLDGRCGPRC